MQDPRPDENHEAGPEIETLAEILRGLIDRYGFAYLQEELGRYVGHLEEIAALNAQLTQFPEQTSDDYNAVVRQIIDATQSYYQYIAALQLDVRQFFLTLPSAPEHGWESILEALSGEGMGLPGETLSALLSSPLLKAQSIRPQNYIMQIDAITNQLAALGDQNELRVGRKGSQPVVTTVTLDRPDHLRLEGGRQLTTYDKSILNGVTSLLESGNTVFSIPMLYHAMTGRQNPSIDDALHEEISARLEMMRRTMLTIDLTEEAEAGFFGDAEDDPPIQNLELEGYLLPLNRLSGTINGKKTELYQLIQHPPIYAYSKMRRQLASVDINLMRVPVNNNSTTITLRTYLLQRIEMIRNDKNNITQSKILYESIYQELDASNANKTRKMRIRKYTTTMLDYYVEEGYIESYVEYRKGQKIEGINIRI